MAAMATKVEYSTRTIRSDIINDANSSRTYISPLSDASNKSTDPSISSSLIIEDNIRNTSKTLSMLNSGLKPRLSPKPFSREKPPENRKSIGMSSTFSGDVKQQSDVPFQATTIISLSGSTKSNENERVGRRIFTSSSQASTDEDQGNKTELFSPTAAGWRQISPSWTPGANNITEYKSILQTDERKVSSKPPIISRKPEHSQQEKVYPSYSRRTLSDFTDETREPEDKNVGKAKPENIDSLTVRAQLRQKRRPVSAAFLESTDPVSDQKVAEEPRKWNRRPLSEDLTSLFESRGIENKTDSPSEETKENRPFKKNSINSITNEQSKVGAKEGDYASDKNFFSDTSTGVSGISLRNTYFAHTDKSKEMPSNKQIADVGENEGIMKLSANINNQSLKFLQDQYDGLHREVKKSDESDIPPIIMKRRISLYNANTSSSEEADVPSYLEDKNTANTERTSRSLDQEAKSLTEWTTSPSPTMTDFTKKFFNSPSKLEMRSEKPNEERRSSFSYQDFTAQKEKKERENSSLLEERTFRTRSIRKNDEIESADVSKNRTDFSYKVRLNDAKIDVSEEIKNPTQVEKTLKTVKATMFENNVERHSPPEVCHSGNLMSSKPPRSTVISDRLRAKRESLGWLEWLSGDNVQSVSPTQKDLNVTASKSSEKSAGAVSSSAEVGNLQRTMLQNLKVDENRRVEPKYEVVQAVVERVQSESIEMATEDKALTLRTRRSFRNKDWEIGKDGDERSGTSLQRSKSAYQKRNALNSPQENSQGKFFSRDSDFLIERKNASRTEKNESADVSSEILYKKERIFSSKNGTDFDFKDKSQTESNRENTENTAGKYTSEYSHFGTVATGKGEVKTSFRSFNQQSDKLISPGTLTESEKGIKTVKEHPTVARSNARDEINNLSQVKENKKKTSLNQFNLPKVATTKNINKEESNEFTNIMLNKEIEQMKKELFTARSTKEAGRFQKNEYKEESKVDSMQLKSNDSFQDEEKVSDNMRRSSDLYKSLCEKPTEIRFQNEKKDNMNIIAAKDPSPLDKKATYFAVTGVDSKKLRNNDGENLISSNTSLSEETYLKRSVRMDMTNSNSHSNSITQEKTNAEKDVDTSHASKGFKTYKNVQGLQDNYIADKKSKKVSETGSSIDIDALLKRHKQKSSVDDEGSSYLDTQTKHIQKSYLIEPENTQESNFKGSPLKLDGTYKSKVLDIDSLMADYNQKKNKENKARDDNPTWTKWERSRSFRESGVSKSSSSKWKDPSDKHFNNDQGYKYEAVAPHYTSPQETTSTMDEFNQGRSKSLTLLDNSNKFAEGNNEKEPYKGREVRDILESSVKTHNYKAQMTQSFESTRTESRSTTDMHGKQMLIKMSGDDQNGNEKLVEREHQSSTHRESIPEEKTQPLSEGRKSGKAGDLISMMLENKEKRMEHHRSRQSVPVEVSQEKKTQRLVSLEEWTYNESKELKQRPTRIREVELATDQSRGRRLNRNKDYTNEDHVKQCFSRSSTSNKDTDSLVQETDRQYGTWGQDKKPPEGSFVQESPSYDNISSRKQQSHSRLSSLSHTETDQHDSIAEAHDGSLDRSSMDLDSTDGTASTPSFHEAKAGDFSFMDQTSVLDSTALKNRVQLSRKSQRRAPSQTQRRSRLLLSSSQLAVIEDTDSPWMFTDSTEDKPEKKDEVDEEEEKPQRSSLQSQRMPMFPGMDHSSLMAQLRKRQEAESSSESSPQPSSPQTSAQPSRSPKSPLPQGTLGVKLLPTSADIQDGAASTSPQWLKELKSKKRQSQYENHS